MDTQLLLVVICVLLAVAYVVRRMYRSVQSGHCACCSGGGNTKRHTPSFPARRQSANADAPVVMEKSLTIHGMRCGHCEAHVTQALEAVDGVVSATADHSMGRATVRLCRDIPAEILSQAVAAAGYEVRDVAVTHMA